MLSIDNYNWVRKLQIGAGQKNISQTIHLVIENYQKMLEMLDKSRKVAEKESKSNQEAHETMEKYRAQILKPNQYDRKVEYADEKI